MKLFRFMLYRIAATIALVLAVAVVLAVWRAQDDVRHEEIGASEVVALVAHLFALESAPAAALPRHIEALQRIDAGGRLRHVQLELRAGDGTLLTASRNAGHSGFIEKLFARLTPGVGAARPDIPARWTLASRDGRRFVASMSVTPGSEQHEAFTNLLGLLGMLLALGVALVAAVYWTLHRTLAPLQPILDAIVRYEQDDFTHRLSKLPILELDRIGQALNGLAASLGATRDARRTLSAKLVSTQEQERTRIARELHDEFGQALTAIRADLAWLTSRTDGQPAEHRVVVDLAGRSARLHEQIRELLRRLRPRGRDPDGTGIPLGRMLRELADSWNQRQGQRTRYEIACDVEGAELPEELALTLYRMTQEALTNAERHAGAQHVRVAVSEPDSGTVVWCVLDDGVGIDNMDAASRRGSGLAGMRERAWAHGGEIEFARGPGGKGLLIRARFPVEAMRGTSGE